MRCDRCGGTLYLDRQSVTDAERSGYVGGRFACLMGCTDVWHHERVERIVPESFFRPSFEITCVGCKKPVTTRHHNTKRCEACRNRRRKEAGRRAWQRYQATLARLKASA